MSKKMVTLKEWCLDQVYIEGMIDEGFGWIGILDKVVYVQKESDDVIIIEGENRIYKLDPPWRVRV